MSEQDSSTIRQITESGVTPQARIRKWAQTQGIDVPTRGRISSDIVERYENRESKPDVESRVDNELQYAKLPWRSWIDASPGKRKIEKFSRGTDVAWIQRVLGVKNDKSGEFGEHTENAIKKYQNVMRGYIFVPSNGIVDRKTWGLIRSGNLVSLSTLVHGFRHAQRSSGVAEIQARLAVRGYNIQIVNGIANSVTRMEYTRFQYNNRSKLENETVGGDPTKESLSLLGFNVSM